MKTGFKVIEAMTHNPVRINVNSTLKKAALLMAERHVGSLLVEDKGNVIGVLSEQDIVRKAVAKGNVGKFLVKHIMETKLITIEPDKDIFEAITMMRDHNIRHLPVMQDNKFYGLVTSKDILKIEPDLFELMVEKIELKEEKNKPIYNISEREGICELCGEYSEEITPYDGALMCSRCKEI
ncbi:CBS domain-containing protein [Candidatus Woesearchaeota archaeon]|nr:CBS domain-containing protein [Candidatus Woesearchaeota archaeon]